MRRSTSPGATSPDAVRASTPQPTRRTPLERALVRRRIRLMSPEQRSHLRKLPAATRKSWEDMTIRASWRQIETMPTAAERREAVDRLANDDRARHVSIASQRFPVARDRERRSGSTRRASSSSSTSGQDPSDPDEPEPPKSGRRCKACGADVSLRRKGAETCDARCRKAYERGVRPPQRITRIERPLEDEIAAKAWQRHLAWTATDVRPGVRDDLTRELEDLYEIKRRRRARRPLPAFEGSIASYDYDVRAAQLWRQPRAPRRRAVTTTWLAAVAA